MEMETLNRYADEVAESVNRAMPKLVYATDLAKGSRWTRLFLVDAEGGKTTHSFIDRNGDVYRPASEKTPAKGVRGNILSQTTQEILDPETGFVPMLKRGRPRKVVEETSQTA